MPGLEVFGHSPKPCFSLSSFYPGIQDELKAFQRQNSTLITQVRMFRKSLMGFPRLGLLPEMLPTVEMGWGEYFRH